ncbi:MAG: hypothetical protein DRI61_17360, partial [Chloroflexi bacterium]
MRRNIVLVIVLTGALLLIPSMICLSNASVWDSESSRSSKDLTHEITAEPVDESVLADDAVYSVNVTLGYELFPDHGGTWDNLLTPQHSWTGTRFGWHFSLDVSDDAPHDVILYALDQEGYDAMGEPQTVAVPPAEHVLFELTMVSGHHELEWLFDSPVRAPVYFILSNAAYNPWEVVTTTGTLTRDMTGPAITIESDSLQYGQIASGTELIHATAADEYFDVLTMSLTIDGTLVKQESGSDLSYSWTTTGYPDGPVSVYIQAEDEAGNLRTYSPYSPVTIDNNAPEIGPVVDMIFPEGNAPTSLQWSVSDVTPSYYTILRDSVVVDEGVWLSSMNTIGVDATSLSALTEGSYNYTLVLEDSLGRESVDTVIVTANTPPDVDSPSDLTILDNETGYITWSPFDLHPDYYQLFRNGSLLLSDVWNGSSITVEVSSFGPGFFNLTLVVFDEIGNMATDTVNVTIIDTVADSDSDSLTDYEEITLYGTDPHDNDTDDDLLLDGDEVFVYATDPLNNDSDSDSLSDGLEVFICFTDPKDADSDDDLMPDGWEVSNGLDPLADDSGGDPDSDGLSNVAEWSAGTDPKDADSDDDLMPDGWEVSNGLDPLADERGGDPDSDGL